MTAPAPEIRDAASLIIIDETTSTPQILLGRRRPDQVFLPNKFVFPGGRVETDDETAPSLNELSDDDVEKLMADGAQQLTPNNVRAFPLAAIRETYEETGFAVGATINEPTTTKNNIWKNFLNEAVCPQLKPLHFLARAITPPGRTRRYDTRFFCVNSEQIAKKLNTQDNELRNISWFTLAQARQLETAQITRIIIEDLADWLMLCRTRRQKAPSPLYFSQFGSLQRRLLTNRTNET